MVSPILVRSFFGIVILIVIFILFWRFHFLRKPKRTIPNGRNIVSPAMGKIVSIVDINNTKSLKWKKGEGIVKTISNDVISSGYLILIMLTPLDVHFQRMPASGKIISTKHSPGSFKNAVIGASNLKGLENEKNEIIIKNKDIGKIKVIQIAGFLARRITSSVLPGKSYSKGEELGLINFGSQVALIIPKIKLEIKEGQNVLDGETIIATY